MRDSELSSFLSLKKISYCVASVADIFITNEKVIMSKQRWEKVISKYNFKVYSD